MKSFLFNPDLERNVSRRKGNMRSVTLNEKMINTDQQTGMTCAIQESIDYTFGLDSSEPHYEAEEKIMR